VIKKYIAFLRGINVGGNNKVEMSKLKSMFEEMDYTNVITYINSGNVIFDATSNDTDIIADQIESKLNETFGFQVGVVVRDVANVNNICKKTPDDWTEDKVQRTYVLFLLNEFDNKEVTKHLNAVPGVDNILHVEGAIIWNMRKADYHKSGMKNLIGTPLYKGSTARNINTVRKLSEMCK